MIAFAIIGSVFCLLLGIDKICDRLKELRHDTNLIHTHLDRIACQMYKNSQESDKGIEK